MSAREDYIARHFDFNGERQHYVTKGNGIREKRGFATEAGARAFLASKKLDMGVYRCSVCGQWHTARSRSMATTPRSPATETQAEPKAKPSS